MGRYSWGIGSTISKYYSLKAKRTSSRGELAFLSSSWCSRVAGFKKSWWSKSLLRYKKGKAPILNNNTSRRLWMIKAGIQKAPSMNHLRREEPEGLSCLERKRQLPNYINKRIWARWEQPSKGSITLGSIHHNNRLSWGATGAGYLKFKVNCWAQWRTSTATVSASQKKRNQLQGRTT